jgi:hypothetical protein
MNFVSRKDARVIIWQIPLLLLFAGALFSLPFLALSVYDIFAGIDADGKYFGLFFGAAILWLFLEFVATRERIEIDNGRRTLTRTVSGVFRRRRQAIGLEDARELALENVPGSTGGAYQHLYLYANDKKYLLNTPSKRYLDHGRLGRLIGEAAGIPYRGTSGE